MRPSPHHSPSMHPPLPSPAARHGLGWGHLEHEGHAHAEGQGGHKHVPPTTVVGTVRHDVHHAWKDYNAPFPIKYTFGVLDVLSRVPGMIGRAAFGGVGRKGSARDFRNTIRLHEEARNDKGLEAVRRALYASEYKEFFATQKEGDVTGERLRRAVAGLSWALKEGKLKETGITEEHIKMLAQIMEMRFSLMGRDDYLLSHWVNAMEDKGAASAYLNEYHEFWQTYGKFTSVVSAMDWNAMQEIWKQGEIFYREAAAKKK